MRANVWGRRSSNASRKRRHPRPIISAQAVMTRSDGNC
jgi:hypothetical protein